MSRFIHCLKNIWGEKKKIALMASLVRVLQNYAQPTTTARCSGWSPSLNFTQYIYLPPWLLRRFIIKMLHHFNVLHECHFLVRHSFCSLPFIFNATNFHPHSLTNRRNYWLRFVALLYRYIFCYKKYMYIYIIY